jgi:hypothetical protein
MLLPVTGLMWLTTTACRGFAWMSSCGFAGVTDVDGGGGKRSASAKCIGKPGGGCRAAALAGC